MRKLSVSMMCVKFGNLEKILNLFKKEKVDYLHIDVMDGIFVPNLMLGTSYEKWIHDAIDIPLDIHLMVEEPLSKLSWFDIREGDIVTVHAESSRNILGAMLEIKKLGAKAYIAISPETPVESIIPIIKYVDGVCVMLVIPGFSGQSMIEGMDYKIDYLREYREKHNMKFDIEVDGHVTKENVVKLENVGANIFVAGTSLLGHDEKNYEKCIKEFYTL